MTTHDCKSRLETRSPNHGFLLTTLVLPLSWVKHNAAVAEWWKTCKKAGDNVNEAARTLALDTEYKGHGSY